MFLRDNNHNFAYILLIRNFIFTQKPKFPLGKLVLFTRRHKFSLEKQTFLHEFMCPVKVFHEKCGSFTLKSPKIQSFDGLSSHTPHLSSKPPQKQSPLQSISLSA